MLPDPASALLAGHTPGPDRFDECVEGSSVRGAWRGLLAQVAKFGDAGFRQRRDQAQRLLRENGVTYNAHQGRGHERPWALDPLPVVFSAAEWAGLARGVAQRARLLDQVLDDLYGPQRILREGLLHPAAVFAHPQFLRPLHGVVPTGERLVMYACDVIRGPDGTWRLLAEHSQSPAGAGYVLENRIIASRVLPEPFKDLRVERLAPFFIALRERLRQLAPQNREHPRIALLTPGPYSETYFEHAYLARYLGYTLVEGADLTVRDDRLYLKTLGGLHRVDVLLRRLADDYCDPLELRTGSVLGVAGLTGAVRSGNVAVANALGSGVSENGAISAAAATLARHLLGEELRLPTVATWWGGADPEGLLARFDHLAIRPAFSARGSATLPDRLDQEAREDLRRQVRIDPTAWIGQERIHASCAPTWNDGKLEPRSLTIRLFAVADPTAPDGYTVMPGGLARVTDAGEAHPFAIERSQSKDVWILAEGPVSQASLLALTTGPVVLRRGGADLPSRVADNLFWTGRYAERSEWSARLAREALRRLADDPISGGGPGLPAVLAILHHLGLRRSEPGQDSRQLQKGLMELVFETARPGGVRDHLTNLRRSAFAVRDRISNDTWRVINRLGALPSADSLDEGLEVLDRLLTDLAALAGLGTENSTRGPAWRFLDLGRRIERAQTIVELLRASWADQRSPPGNAWLDALVDLADGGITYRSRYLTNLQGPPVLDLLLVDPTFPRSVAWQLARITEHLAAIPREQDLALPGEDERIARRLGTTIDLVDSDQLCRPGAARGPLRDLLDRTASDLGDLSEVVTRLYLSHAVPMPHLADGR